MNAHKTSSSSFASKFPSLYQFLSLLKTHLTGRRLCLFYSTCFCLLACQWIRPTEIPTEQNAPKPEKPCFQNTNFEWAEIFKTARLGSHLSALLWLAQWLYSGRWLVIFFTCEEAYTRTKIGRIAFSTCENIAHTEFYIQGLFPKILAIYVIKVNYLPQLNCFASLLLEDLTMEEKKLRYSNNR